MPISPIPLQHESGIGYALRYATRNGIQHLTSLFSAKEIEWLIKGTKYRSFKAGHLESIQTPGSLSTIFNPLFKTNRLLTPRICLTCVSEHQLIADEVQNPFINVCNKHKTPFVELCQQCHEHLEWEIDLLKGKCTNRSCGAPLIANRNIGYPTNLTEEQVSDCVLASTYYAKHAIVMFGRPSKWPNLELPTQAVAFGYQLLTDKETGREWLLKLANEHPAFWPEAFRGIINTTLASHIGDWPNKALFESKLPHCSNTVEAQPFRVNVQQATMLLATNREGILRLQEAELVSRTHSRLHLDSIIDISPVLVLLETQKTKQRCQKSLTELREIMDFYALNLVDILIAIKSDCLNTNYKPGLCITDSIFVTEQELKNFGLRKFKEFNPQYVSFNKASKLTKVSVSSLRLLRKLGRLRPPSVAIHGGHDLCNFEDVIALRNSVESDQLDLFASQVPKQKMSHLVDNVGG